LVIDPEGLSAQEVYKLLIGSVVPRPIAWASTKSKEGVLNLAPFSFFTVVCRKPPMLSMTIQPRADQVTAKDTLQNIRDVGQYVINVVSFPLAEAMHETSEDHPPDADEFEVTGLTPAPCEVVEVPRVEEARVSMECVLERILPLGVYDHLVIGRMVRYHIRDDLLQENGRVDVGGLEAVGRLAGNYTRIEKIFELPITAKSK
jgi:flavin reductase (DIM6/NTAB) family NADH-FMN oxidoreductase RutF